MVYKDSSISFRRRRLLHACPRVNRVAPQACGVHLLHAAGSQVDTDPIMDIFTRPGFRSPSAFFADTSGLRERNHAADSERYQLYRES